MKWLVNTTTRLSDSLLIYGSDHFVLFYHVTRFIESNEVWKVGFTAKGSQLHAKMLIGSDIWVCVCDRKVL